MKLLLVVRTVPEERLNTGNTIMSLFTPLALLLVLIVASVPVCAQSRPDQKPVPAHGPLRVHPTNPRYFSDGTKTPDGSLRAVYLTGSHTWNNLQDMAIGEPPPFDEDAYLDFLERYHHNFIRLWRWEAVTWDLSKSSSTNKKGIYTITPHPWARLGPGTALDGKPKFDLTKFDPAYFERLRSRVQAAGQRGIYASVMLFEGWELHNSSRDWKGHPFHKDNNINGINGDANGDGRGTEVHMLATPAVTRLQEAYVRKVIDTVGDLDNVLYEIANESGKYSTEWQYHLIRFIKTQEEDKAKQHPVGMTFQWTGNKEHRGTNHLLFDSPADWISPNQEAGEWNYKTNPPPADGRKVMVPDTDHLGGIWGDANWVWKSFTRGHNPIFMDPYDNSVVDLIEPTKWEPLRASLGQTRDYADRMNLASMTPRGDLASTQYCLANPGKEYLVYLPDGGEVTVDLLAATGSLTVEWFNPQTRESRAGDQVGGGAKHAFGSPFKASSVLYLRQE